MNRSIFLIPIIILLFIPFGIFSQPVELLTQKWLRTKLNKKETYITMRDGVKLFTSIYTPKNSAANTGIILIRTPYAAEGGGEKTYSRYLEKIENLINKGYIFVIQDVRGKYLSEGEFVDIRPYISNKKNKNDIDESSDAYDTIDWLVKNIDGNNGNVGIFGTSYPGFYSTMAAIDAHPALKAVSPQAPVTNWFIGDDFHHNGAFFIMDAMSFFSGFGRPRPQITRSSSKGYTYPNQDNYDFFLRNGTAKKITEKIMGDSIQFWNDLMAHPDMDDFWKERNPLPHLLNIKPAVLTVGGWFDAEDSWGPQHVYKAIEDQNDKSVSNMLMMGPWFHGQWGRAMGTHLGNVHWGEPTSKKYKDLELSFFNFYLKNKGDNKFSEATLFITGENKWQDFESWPPKNIENKKLYFHNNGKLSFNKPTSTQSYDEYISDPNKPVPYTEDVHLKRTREYMTDDQRFAARRPDVMVYESETLEEDVTIAGPIRPDLWVSTTGTDADYIVKVIDVFPDDIPYDPKNDKGVPMAGYQMMVRGDVIRGRYRNSLENPEPFDPELITNVSYEMPGVAHTFKKGHRIMVQVQNSWFPLIDRNPQQFINIYECNEADFIKTTNRIYLTADHASNVEVMILKK